jgi:hypothetical protein
VGAAVDRVRSRKRDLGLYTFSLVWTRSLSGAGIDQHRSREIFNAPVYRPHPAGERERVVGD